MTVQPLYFLHIPKTAGTSLNKWLRDYFDDRYCCPHNHLASLQHVPQDDLSRYQFFAGHFVMGLYKLLQTVPSTITLLREPSERVFSSYRYERKKKDELITVAQDLGMDHLVSYYEEVSKLSIEEYCYLYQSNIHVRYLSGNIHVQHLSGQIRATKKECNREMLELAITNLEKLTHFGICEWMQPSIDLMCYQLGWISRPFNLRLNQTPTNDKKYGLSSLTEEERQALIDNNKYDYALYEYARQRFKQFFQEMWEKVPEHEEALKNALLKQNNNSKSCTNTSKQIDILDDNFLGCYEFLSSGCITDYLKENFQSIHQADERHELLYLSCSNSTFHTGWHPREYNFKKQEWFRWNSSKRKTIIYLPLKTDQWYRISFSILFKTKSEIKKFLELKVNHKAITLEFISISSTDGEEQYIATGMLSPDCISAENAYAECVFSINNQSNENFLADYDRSFAIGDIHIEPYNKVSSPFQVILDLHKQIVQEKNNSSNTIQKAIHLEKIDKTKNSRFKKLKDKNKKLKQRLQKYQTLLIDSQKKLEESQKELEAIKESKLWKIRGVWVQIKRKLGLIIDS